MKRAGLFLAALFCITLMSSLASAQVPITYYDFESNANRTVFENAVEQTINAGSGAITRAGNITTVTGVAGAGTFNGGPATGQAATSSNWDASTIDPGAAATNYYQFVVNTSGFSQLSLIIDNLASATGPARIGVLYSTNGTTFTAVGTALTGNNAFSKLTADLTGIAAINNQSSVTIRLYAYAGSAADRTGRSAFASGGTFRIDNLEVRALSTVAGAGTKTLLDEASVFTSTTSGTTGSLFIRTNFTVNGAGTTVSTFATGPALLAEIFNGTLAITNNATFTLAGSISANLAASAVTVSSGGTFNCGTLVNVVVGSGSFTLNSGTTLLINSANGITAATAAGNIQVTGTRTFSTGANYTYNGSAAQVTGNGLPATVNNLTINNSAGVTLSGSTAVNGTQTLTIGALSIGANTLTLNNALTITGGSLTGGNTSNIVVGDAGLATNLTLPAITLNNLTLNRATGLTLGGNVTVGGTLTLTSGILNTGANTLTMGDNATSNGSSTSYVVGTMRKIYATTPKNFTFDLGTVGGTTDGYTPATVNALAGTGDVTATVINAFHPTLTGRRLRRYWSLTNNGITSANLSFTYLDGDVPAPATDEATYVAYKIDGATVTFPVPGSAVNAATNMIDVTGATSFSDWTAGVPDAPTLVKLRSFKATNDNGDVMLRWESGYEVDNLGYNVYRQQNGKRTRVTPSMIAGSALLAGERTVLTAGQSYTWFDRMPQDGGSVTYLLEDVDLNGKRTLHGPVTPVKGKVDRQQSAQAQAALLNQLPVDNTRGQTGWATSWNKQQARLGDVAKRSAATLARQQDVVEQAGVKIMVRQSGWVRVSQPELVAAGLSPTADAASLQLYTDGAEVSVIVSGNQAQLTENDWVEFYGQGLDLPTTGTRTYYLVSGTTNGKRIPKSTDRMGAGDRNTGPTRFNYTVERQERSVFFSGLDNGDADNFFGQVINSTTPTQSSLSVQHLDATTGKAQLSVTLQGVTAGAHQVNVKVNGADVGAISFNGREHPTETFTISPSLLHDGENSVRMVSANGETDINLVDKLRLTYPHSYVADNNALLFSINTGAPVSIDGFSASNVRIMDITNPAAVKELVPGVKLDNGSFTATVRIADAGTQNVRTMLAFLDNQPEHPASVTRNEPSTLADSNNRADFLIITQRNFVESVQPLADLRRSQGLQVSVVDVEDVYDEFSYGAHSPQAIRDFITRAAQDWQLAPRYVLLVGDATYDPRNYLGQGDNDLVPTKMLYTGTMLTASDDWVADFNNDAVPELAVGRLPVRTAQDAATIIGKITNFSPNSAGQGALLVADRNDDQHDFEAASQSVQSRLPEGTPAQVINRGNNDTATVRAQIINGINQGPLVVNYFGHGSVGLWTGAGLLNTSDAAALTNGTRLPLFTIMTCLNGFFHDVNGESMSEALLKASQGGAIAVWASSGLTDMNRQSEMDQQLYGAIFGTQSVPLGDAIRAAKATTQDQGVRRTWVFFGDPTMRLR